MVGHMVTMKLSSRVAVQFYNLTSNIGGFQLFQLKQLFQLLIKAIEYRERKKKVMGLSITGHWYKTYIKTKMCALFIGLP